VRENRTHGSEGGEGNLPDPYVRPRAYHIREVKVPFRETCFHGNRVKKYVTNP
jgi:hypothetical protein